jgi:hypothetical protein
VVVSDVLVKGNYHSGHLVAYKADNHTAALAPSRH